MDQAGGSQEEHRPTQPSYWNRRSFRHEAITPARRILTGLMITLLIVFAAIFGYVLYGWSWQDALYMVVITIFGVGYGETQPVDTPFLRWLTISLIICGYVAAIYTVGGFAQLLLDGELRRLLGVKRMKKEIERLSDHVVICGFGRMGRKLAQALATHGKDLIVIEQVKERVEAARGFGCLAIHGNATEEHILRQAGLERAAILTTVLSDDVSNLFITITARGINPQLEILARAEHTSTIKKLEQVGASHVILPANIGADRLANMILHPSAESLLSQTELPESLTDDLSSLGLRLGELEVTASSPLLGSTLDKLLDKDKHRFLVIAIRNRAGEVSLQPAGDYALKRGDCVILLAPGNELDLLQQRYAQRSEMETTT